MTDDLRPDPQPGDAPVPEPTAPPAPVPPAAAPSPWEAAAATPPAAPVAPVAPPDLAATPPAAPSPWEAAAAAAAPPAAAAAPAAPPVAPAPLDAAAPGAVPPMPIAGAYDPGQAAPGGAYPAIPSAPGEPVAPQAKPKRGGLMAGIAAGVVALGAIGVKFILPLIVGGAVSGAFGVVFGGPFEKLPSDQKQAMQARYDKAVGDSMKNLSDAEVAAKVDKMITAGLPRLTDQQLVERIGLSSTLLQTTDVANCATMARATVTGGDTTEQTRKALDALDTAKIGRWFDINLSALEAEAAGAPAMRTTDSAKVDTITGNLFTAFTTTEAQHFQDLYAGTEQADADACDAIRALYKHINELPATDLAVIALYEVSP